MRKVLLVTVLLIFYVNNAGAQTASTASQGQSRLKAFADSISPGAQSSYEKAEKAVRWLANNFDWIEIYDDKQSTWIPADPSLGVMGEQQWIESRAGFGKRFTLDASSEDMIVPIAIFATDENGKFIENRTQHYVIDGLNHLYNNKLAHFRNWENWKSSVDALDEKCWAAFLGEVNLHDYESQIDALAVVYNDLKTEYQASQHDKSH